VKPIPAIRRFRSSRGSFPDARRTGGILLLTVLFFLSPAVRAAECPDLGFSGTQAGKSVPPGWEILTYPWKAENLVSLVREGKTRVLHMKSLNSVSGVMRRFDGLAPAECSGFSWRWKVSRSVGMAVEHLGDRCDAAARVRVIFGRESRSPWEHPLVVRFLESLGVAPPVMEPPGHGIDYLWGNGHPPGTVLDDPRSSRRKLLVLEQGNGKAGRWVLEERDLEDDFRRCFGEPSPGVAAVVLLSDTDDTNEGVEAWFGNLRFTGPAGK
jgi:hypothetical protein